MSTPTFYKRNQWLVMALAIFALLALIIAYQPVMFNFFCSDDFYVVGWLNQCKQNVLLLFHTVYEGTPYYRPLLNLFLFFEYVLCGPNSVLFRALSLLYLLITAYILWLLVGEFANELNGVEISGKADEKNTWAKTNWCLFSAGFFLLFPLHTEPVNWFVSTTDLLVNIFILASFLLFIYWRNRNLLRFRVSSYLLAACALLTKEIAVILPAILFVYELLVKGKITTNINQDTIKQLPKTRSFAVFGYKLFNAIRVTAVYWFLLVIYFCLRKMMTGEFLGNWSNAAFHFSDNQMMFESWWQSIKIILNPISSAAFGQDIPVHLAWILMLIDLTFLTLASVYKSWQKISLLLFFVCWFFISLIPMAKLLLITPDLLDARYGYIASIPLCILLMLGLAFRDKPSGINYARHLIFIIVISFCCFVLRLNNSIWAEAGELTNTMLAGFQLIHKQISDTTKIYFINIPVKYKGVAIAGITGIDSMNHKPFLDKDYNNCIWLADEDQSLPIGVMTEDFEADKITAHFYCLDKANKYFRPINVSRANNISFKSIGFAVSEKTLKSRRDNISNRPRRQHFATTAPLELNCWGTDAIIMKVDMRQCALSFKDRPVRMSLYNDILPVVKQRQTNASLYLTAPILNRKGEQVLVFYLRGKPIWSFGGQCHSIAVSFPKGCVVSIKNAYAIKLSKDMPKITFTSANYNAQIGQVDLDIKTPSVAVNYDASFIPNCVGVFVEIIDRSEYFTELNSRYSEIHSLVDLCLIKPKGQIRLDSHMVKGSGYYKVRLRPIDKAGKQCAFCSDHFVLHVSN